MTLLRHDKTRTIWPQCLPGGNPAGPSGPRWTASTARLIMHKFCDGLAQGSESSDELEFIAVDARNCTFSQKAFVRKELEACQFNKAHRKAPANALVMPSDPR